MFLAELTKKLALKKRQEEEAPANVVRELFSFKKNGMFEIKQQILLIAQPTNCLYISLTILYDSLSETIIDSLTNASPVILTKKSPTKKESPVKLEELSTTAPELVSNETIDIIAPSIEETEMENVEAMLPAETSSKIGFKMPRMPLVSSDVLKIAALANRAQIPKEDMATMTGAELDVASEIAKHVNTLRKISLIAEEFNQKTGIVKKNISFKMFVLQSSQRVTTRLYNSVNKIKFIIFSAKNLKEIVDSVQEDLVKKLHEIQAEQKVVKAQKDALEEQMPRQIAYKNVYNYFDFVIT